MLATILVVAAAGSQPAAVEAGPRDQIGQLDAQNAPAGRQVRYHRGRLIKSCEEGILATFDAPGQAIRCATAVRDDAAARGIQIRAGIHTGEVDLVGGDIAGTSVHITDRVAAIAQPAEILVSRTVKDLVAGSGISFASRGNHELTGPQDEWPLFAVTGRQT